MACVKLGSKADAFKRQGLAWFCTTGLPRDIIVEVGEMSFHLHKFPLLSRSAVLERLIGEVSDRGEANPTVQLPGIPGGSRSFELVAKFCYGVKLELTAANVVYLHCAAEFLEMTEDYGDGNLIAHTENFLNQVVLKSWKDSVKALQTCGGALPHAEDLGIVKRCIDSLATKASMDPNLFGWPMMERGPMQSPGGSVLWNGISTGARPKTYTLDWWYEDVSCLSLPIYKRLILAMESRGIVPEILAGSLAFYAKKYVPGLNRRHGANEPGSRLAIVPMSSVMSEEEQKLLIEEIDEMLPMQKGLVPAKFLFGLLRTAMILRASSSCLSNLEKRIGMQLEHASLDDLLLPTFSHSMETLYDVDCIQRILEHFLAMDQAAGGTSPYPVDDERSMGSPSLTPITTVAKLIDSFLAEVAPDVNLKLPKFQSLAGTVPDFARPLDDGLYRAIDIYLKAHPCLSDSDREQLMQIDGLPEALSRGVHARRAEREAPSASRGPSPLFRAAAAEDIHRRVLPRLRQPRQLKAASERPCGQRGRRRQMGDGRPREPDPEVGYGQHANARRGAGEGVHEHEAGDREAGPRKGRMGQGPEEVWFQDEVADVQRSRRRDQRAEEHWEREREGRKAAAEGETEDECVQREVGSCLLTGLLRPDSKIPELTRAP